MKINHLVLLHLIQVSIVSSLPIINLGLRAVGLKETWPNCNFDFDAAQKTFKAYCANQNMDKIPWNLYKWTKDLDLSGNKIKEIRSYDVLPNLIKVNLSRNQIDTIKPQTFETLTTLETLDLSYNSLSDIQEMAFEKLRNLKMIDLSHNSIKNIGTHAFNYHKALEALFLRGNRLTKITEDIFWNDRLRILDFSYNPIFNLPDFALAKNLVELDISASIMRKLDHKSFIGLRSLQILRINQLPELIAIEDYTFTHLNSLRYLEIKNNPRLNTLSSTAFYSNTSSPVNLAEVHLNGNQLSRLTLDTLSVCNLSRVDLRDNPWRCDCHFDWVKTCKQHEPIHQQIKCALPTQLAGQEIGSIDAELFICTKEEDTLTYPYTDTYSRVQLIRLFMVLFGISIIVSIGLIVIFYFSRKDKVNSSFRVKFKRVKSVNLTKDQANPIIML